jgi:hypothetical protein
MLLGPSSSQAGTWHRTRNDTVVNQTVCAKWVVAVANRIQPRPAAAPRVPSRRGWRQTDRQSDQRHREPALRCGCLGRGERMDVTATTRGHPSILNSLAAVYALADAGEKFCPTLLPRGCKVMNADRRRPPKRRKTYCDGGEHRHARRHVRRARRPRPRPGAQHADQDKRRQLLAAAVTCRACSSMSLDPYCRVDGAVRDGI